MAKPRTKPASKPTSKAAPKRPRPLLAPRSALIDCALALPGTSDDVKWQDNYVIMVGGKMFAIFECDAPSLYAFKCDPEDFERLCERPGIIPAPYAARFGWVKVMKPGALKAAEAKKLIAKAHGLVLACLPAKKRAEIERG